MHSNMLATNCTSAYIFSFEPCESRRPPRVAEPAAMGQRATPASSATPAPPVGYKQKLAWAASRAAEQTPPSSLARVLLTKWAWGDISTPMLQQIAQAAVQDGASHVELVKLAKLGHSGQYPGNMHAELARKLAKSHVAECLRDVRVHLKSLGQGVLSATHSVLLPHELFAAMYREHHDKFVEHLLGGADENIGLFWDAMSDHPCYVQHPLRKRQDHCTTCIPISVHGDGVTISGVGRSWSKSVDVYSWSSMLGHGNTLQTNFMAWLLFWKLRIPVAGMDAFDKISKLFCWSLYWLFIGQWPQRCADGSDSSDPKAGTPLADGFYCALWGIRADLEHMAKCFGFPHPAASRPQRQTLDRHMG